MSKNEVREFWEEAPCGERLYLASQDVEGFRKQSAVRYELEPFIIPFVDFRATMGRSVLEIGVGLGADHQRFAEAGAVLSGIDLTPRAIEITRRRFELFGLRSDLRMGDAENLSFADDTFDLVYSWGVIHHTPDTPKAVQEIFRVLKPGGLAKVMIYNKYSLVGAMLWLRYALGSGRPFTSLDTIYAKYLESPGTRAYTPSEARVLFRQFRDVIISTRLAHADLLTSQAGQRHRGIALSIARSVWPRWLLRRMLPERGLCMMITAVKPA